MTSLFPPFSHLFVYLCVSDVTQLLVHQFFLLVITYFVVLCVIFSFIMVKSHFNDTLTEKLIELIRNVEPIYNPKNSNHHDVTFMSNTWKSIARKMGMLEEDGKYMY